MNRHRLALLVALLLLLAAAVSLAGCGGVAGVDVELTVDGSTRSVHTEAATVLQLLREQGFTLGDLDKVTPPSWQQLSPGLVITIVRVQERFETATAELQFSRRTVRDEALPVGETKLVQLGANGVEELTYRVVTEDGQEVSRTLSKRVTAKPPVDQIAVVGAKGSLPAVPISGTLAYASGGNAWLIRETSEGRRPLTSEGDLDLHVFELSPDGGHLLFTRSVSSTQNAPLNSLWIVTTTVKGESPVRLDVDGVLRAAWSPDGKRFAFSTAARATAAPGWTARNDLWIAESPSFSPTLVLHPSSVALYSWWGETFRWSPDGARLAYADASEVGLIDLKLALRQKLVEFPSYNSRSSWVWTPTPSWSPDGKFIAAAVHGSSGSSSPEDSPIFDIWVISVDAGLIVPVVREAGMWSTPTWSPPGMGASSDALLAFGVAETPSHSQYSMYSLYVMDRDGSNRRKLLPQQDDAPLDILDLAWSPQGDALIAARQGDLVLIDARTGKVSLITADGDSSNPRWAR
jgi:resuscitation-promoting factor RpfB